MTKKSRRYISVFLAAAMITTFTPAEVLSVTAEDISYPAAQADSVSSAAAYMEAAWSGSEVTYTAKTADNCTAVDSTATAWTAGWYVVNSSVTVADPITVSGAVNLILADGCTLNANSGIVVTSGNSLTVYAQSGGSGTLNATGVFFYDETTHVVNAGAGIGGSGTTPDSGAVTIHGGVINATGGGQSGYYGGAGIGGGVPHSGNGGSSGAITIYGGTVTADSGEGNLTGAGIGGGGGDVGGNGNDITIYGGSVTATSTGLDTGGAGIGGGGGFTGGGGDSNIQIHGGTVNATGGYMGAGIGGGADTAGTSGNGTVTISGGKVTAIGGKYAAGIGGGGGYSAQYSSCTGGTGSVTITGGIVDASSPADVYYADYKGDPIGNGGNTSGGTPSSVTKTEGIVFENGVGTVYGNVTLTEPLTVPDGYSLTFDTGATVNGELNVPNAAAKAEKNGAVIGYYGESNLADAFTNEGATVTLLDNITTGTQIDVNTENLTLDLNGKTYTYIGNTAFMVSSGSLTIKGSGKITASSFFCLGVTNGILNIESGSFSGEESAVAVDGTLQLTGGSFTGGKKAIIYVIGDVTEALANYGGAEAPHYAFYQNGKPYEPEGNSLPSGTFEVKECKHEDVKPTSDSNGKHTLNCPYCGFTGTAEDCTYGDKYTTDETNTNHIQTCTLCGYTVTGAHTTAKNENAATCEKKAVCDVCGKEYGELAEHSYSAEWQSDETNHWHECTVCHNDEKDTAAHTWGEGVETTSPTEDTEGVMTYTCTVCGATKTEKINKLPHTHILTKTDEVPATCTAAGTGEYWTCSKCGEMFSDENGTAQITEIPSIPALGHLEEIIPEVPAACTAAGSTAGAKCSRCATVLTAPETIPATGHKYGTDWKSDETGHWHECTVCGDKTGFAAHTSDSGTVTVRPTTETTGLRVYACTECGAKIREETIPVLEPDHEHEYGTDWKFNSDHHWHECICGETSELSAHTWDSGVPVTAPTCTEAGVVTYTCTVCGITKTEPVNALGHSFTNYIYNNDATCTEDGTETAVCDRCSETSTRTAVGSKKGHTEDSGTVTKQPTETEAGIRTFYCTVCGSEVRTETIPPVPAEHTHVFGTVWIYDTTSHWHECTCGEKSDTASHISDSGTVTKQPTATETGTRTYKCTVCGYVMNTETIPATGEEHTHIYGTAWNYDSTSHWHECSCGEKSDTASHISDGGTVTKQPTATETGVRTFKCTVCGYVMNTETIPATGTPTTPVTPPSVPSIPSNPTTSVTTPQTPSKEPFIQGDNGKTGWEAISDTILNTPDGGTVTINMNDTTELPKDIVSQIQGRDIDLVLDMGSGFTWTINGMSVNKAKTVDMKVRKASKIPKSVIEEYFGDLETIQIDLSHNGDFGFIAELTIDLGSKYNGMYANSYCYKSRKFEFGDSAEISDGQAKLRFAHASSWLVAITDESAFEDVSSAAGVTEDSDIIDFGRNISYSFLSVILILGIVIAYFKKSRQK